MQKYLESSLELLARVQLLVRRNNLLRSRSQRGNLKQVQLD